MSIRGVHNQQPNETEKPEQEGALLKSLRIKLNDRALERQSNSPKSNVPLSGFKLAASPRQTVQAPDVRSFEQKSFRSARNSAAQSQKSSPSEVKERLMMRLMIKMEKQFGGDQNTQDVISRVIQEKVSQHRSMQTQVIDDIEQEIFNRISNNLQCVAINEFQPGLITNPNRQKFRQFGDPILNVGSQSHRSSTAG